MEDDEVDTWETYDLPAEPLTDEAVWNGAKQMQKLFAGEAEQAAAHRADKALEQGDLSGFVLWNRIAKAVKELMRQPDNRNVIN